MERLHVTRRDLHEVLDALPVGVLLFDSAGRCVDHNESAEHILDATSADLDGWAAMTSRVQLLDRSGAFYAGGACPIDGDRAIEGTVIGIGRSTGNPRWIRVSGTSIGADGPSRGGMVVTLEPLPAQLDDGLAANEFDAFDRLPASVVMVSLDGTIGYINKSATILFDRAPSDIVGHRIADLLPEDRRAEVHAIRAELDAGRTWVGTSWIRRGEGTVEISASISLLVHRGTRTGFVGVFNPVGAPMRGATPPPTRPGSGDLTAAEANLMRLVAGGLTNKEIAREIHMSPYTVRDAISALMARVGAKNRAELAAAGVRRGL